MSWVSWPDYLAFVIFGALVVFVAGQIASDVLEHCRRGRHRR